MLPPATPILNRKLLTDSQNGSPSPVNPRFGTLLTWLQRRVLLNALDTTSRDSFVKGNAPLAPLIGQMHDVHENPVSLFFRTHPHISPDKLVQETVKPENKKAEGGTRGFYPIQWPELSGFALLAPLQESLSVVDARGISYPAGVFTPKTSPLQLMPDVGAVMGYIGKVQVVRIVAGEPVGSYYEPPITDLDTREFLFYDHSVFASLTPAERQQAIAEILADPAQAKAQRRTYRILQPALLQAFEARYVAQVRRIANLDPEAYREALKTLLILRKNRIALDLNHPMNTMISEGAEISDVTAGSSLATKAPPRFGFVDLKDLGGQSNSLLREFPSVDEQLMGLGLVLLGMGLGFYGPLWVMVSPESDKALCEAVPQIIQKLSAAAKEMEIPWAPDDLIRQVLRRTSQPALAETLRAMLPA